MFQDIEAGEISPTIQVLGKSKCGKTTLISQLMNHSVIDGRFEHTASLVEYTANIRLSEVSEYRPVVPLSYNISLFDVPGEASNRIDANSFEDFLLKNIAQPDINPLSEEAMKSHKYMEQRRLAQLATTSPFPDLFSEQQDEYERTHLLTDHIDVDVDTILRARDVLKRIDGTAATIINGGYIVMFDMNDASGSFEKAKAIVTRIRSQSVLVPIALFANKSETSRSVEDKQYKNNAMKFAYNNDAAYFEGSALMNYVTIDPRSAVKSSIESSLVVPEQKLDAIVNWVIYRMLHHLRNTPAKKAPESDTVLCWTILKYTIFLPFVILWWIWIKLWIIICYPCSYGDSGDANDL